MKLSILSHDLSSSASMRAHRLAAMAEWFAEVEIVGPAKDGALWPALPRDPRIRTVAASDLPNFFSAMSEMAKTAEGDVLVAAGAHLGSLGAAFLASSIKPRPVLLDVTSAPDGTGGLLTSPTDPVYERLMERAAAGADARTASSPSLCERFGATLLPHGGIAVDPGKFRRDDARMRFNLPLTAQIVVYPGVPGDEIETVVAAAKRCRVLVAAPAHGRFLDLPSPPLLRLPVLRLGEIPWLLAAADAAIVTGPDGLLPMKLFDAMAMGTPVIATSSPDIAGTLDGCAVLVPPSDAEALADAIDGMIDDPAGARALGDAARERFLASYTTEQLSETLKLAVDAARKRAAKRARRP